MSERQGIQTPSLAPRAPPSRLKPEKEPQKVVVFLREPKLGAGSVASVVAGLLWDHVSHTAVFYYGAISSIAGSVGLLFIR